MHDLSLRSGERQVAARFEDVRADHRFRYEAADALMPPGLGADVFCGTGYGTHHLALRRHRSIIGVDGSAEAIGFAQAHFAHPHVSYRAAYWPFPLPIAAFDFVVAFESIEHVPDGAALLQALARSIRPGGQLIFSTPNGDRLPHAPFAHFHARHFSTAETLQLAIDAGLQIINWMGQDVYRLGADRAPIGTLIDDQQRLRPGEGQFTIVHCRR